LCVLTYGGDINVRRLPIAIADIYCYPEIVLARTS
jgi:hypothetical protein